MERYFEKFQTIEYANTVARNITQRAVVIGEVYNNPLFYYPYDIAPGERPDMIADRYYGDQYMAWSLYLANKVIDPYYDWHMDQATLDAFIIKKYGSLAVAMTKIKNYTNNWFSDPDPSISASVYTTLDSSLQKFYEPVPINGIVTASPIEYTRRREDWTVKTNAISRYAVANGAGFVADEIVNINFSPSQTGTGQVAFANTTTLVLQNLAGTVTTGTITGSSYVYGRESTTNTIFTTATSVANLIPATESAYWSPVTYYDYENSINERNKSILVLKSQYGPRVARQLKEVLK